MEISVPIPSVEEQREELQLWALFSPFALSCSSFNTVTIPMCSVDSELHYSEVNSNSNSKPQPSNQFPMHKVKFYPTLFLVPEAVSDMSQ